jgi:hypothetical protein
MNFDLSKGSLKIWEFIKILTPKMKVHTLTFFRTPMNVNVTFELH